MISTPDRQGGRRIPARKRRGTPKILERTSPATQGRRSRVAIAMAGGGPLGASYEIGVLAALAEGIRGLDLNDLDIYVGVSAGGILGAALANGIKPRELVRLFIDVPQGRGMRPSADERLDPALLMRPAYREIGEGVARLPQLSLEAMRYLLDRGVSPGALAGFAERLLRALPAGFFSNRPLTQFLARQFARPGRSDDFRRLKARLFLIATDLDAGKAVAFGGPGYDDVPISLAAAASSALPGLFPPVEIGGRHYVDGALQRTLHASVALKEGADLVLCLNPLVPYDDGAVSEAGGVARRLTDGGLPFVVQQTIRAVIHSRMAIGMRQYADDFPDADVVLFEPARADAELFFSSLFSYSRRRRVCEQAYQSTRRDLLRRQDQLAPILARHGMALDTRVLRRPDRSLLSARVPDLSSGLIPVMDRLRERLSEVEGRVAKAGLSA
jgi:predicted acylesterase/phospholipase RssA